MVRKYDACHDPRRLGVARTSGMTYGVSAGSEFNDIDVVRRGRYRFN